MRTRPPAQAGTFYPDTEGELRTNIQNCFLHALGPRSIPSVPSTRDDQLVGIVVPHAGYDYSGPVAANSYYRLASSGLRESVIILGPNHTGYGSGVSTMTDGQWATPLGDVPLDKSLASSIISRSGLIDVEDEAHRTEHSIEVQIPFLQFIYPRRFEFVPICMMLQDLETSKEIGNAIAGASAETGAMLIASSDWTHYESHESAKKKDMEAIQAVLEMDEKKFQDTIEGNHVSACGYGPVTAVLHASKVLGAKHAKLLSYQTSGDTAGDKRSVVGYAAIAFTK
ncbi:MAG: AmmeMemoRadiSam system protein B [Crenarchaeota archaeon 13_1_40CM_3_52_17]|nr:MAG: AmmeMemoRadiSam system protein B [Crenarchaeota archaeon 13_1_40CM_3_52_17]